MLVRTPRIRGPGRRSALSSLRSRTISPSSTVRALSTAVAPGRSGK